MRKEYVSLVVVLLSVAIIGRQSWRSRPVEPLLPTPGYKILTGVNGIAPGMSRQYTEQVLGHPACQGHLEVAGGTGRYAEYGSKTLTWNGHPTLTFTPKGEVLSVIGDRFTIPGSPGFALGSNYTAVRETLGPPTRDEPNQTDPASHCLSYTRPVGTINVFMVHDQVQRLMWYR